MSSVLPGQGLVDPTPKWRRLLWLVLLAYRTLRLLIGERSAISAIQAVLSYRFRKHTQMYLTERFGITQDTPEKAFDCISQNYKVRGEQLFGPGWDYVTDIQDSNHSFTNINKCLFNDFFQSHRTPELTFLFCTIDLIWVDEIHKPCYGVHFERPTTLAMGDDACRFQFSRLTQSDKAAQPGVPPDRIRSR
jgi:hypothetical protein